MSSAKSLAKFFLLIAVIDALLISPWLGVPRAYQAAFVAGGNLAFATFGSNRSVRLQAVAPATDSLDVQVSMTNTMTRDRGSFDISSRYYGLMPTAFLVALIVATPSGWKRRAIALVVGLVAMSMLVMARVLIAMLVNFSPADHPGLVSLSPWLRAVLAQADAALSVPLVGWFVVPLLIWIVLASRERGRWLNQPSDSD